VNEKQVTRFAFIEAMLYVHGMVRRSDVETALQVKTATATKLLAAYAAKCPRAMHYHPGERAYIAHKPRGKYLDQRGGNAALFLGAIYRVSGIRG